jgi:hypothetical protein
VEELAREFLQGRAEVNLATFKLAMYQFKRMMFEKLDANGG